MPPCVVEMQFVQVPNFRYRWTSESVVSMALILIATKSNNYLVLLWSTNVFKSSACK